MGNELAKAKLQVMGAVPYIQKRRAAGLNYSFAGEAAIIEKLHPAMMVAGLTFAPTGCVLIAQENYTTSKGSAMNRVIVQGTFTLTHAESGQTEVIQALGEGADSGDKATSKAMTSALKYALRQAFLIETGDDPDETPSEQQERARPQQKQAAKSNAVRPSNDELKSLMRSRGWASWKSCIHAINGAEGMNYLEDDLPDNIVTDHLARFCDHLRTLPEVQTA